ncbi:hypothetical protein V496_04312 [Pseudogymnoascus sp. VKM F-4515 (FW-2607)]|nr:hypothetical protein V496_04312 [Pseudogymnoascus sp. VKM F-4515 (FW-2607)]
MSRHTKKVSGEAERTAGPLRVRRDPRANYRRSRFSPPTQLRGAPYKVVPRWNATERDSLGLLSCAGPTFLCWGRIRRCGIAQSWRQGERWVGFLGCGNLFVGGREPRHFRVFLLDWAFGRGARGLVGSN